ncbi:Protein kinase [Mycena indigotica]|uniref:non-specific serine/threonine protein kinase n=1 Tax=Mycena indigotica TaxID=2126181 RepID=A0A8H6W310_9AGAR|nr:Protein kinase [Mycena indigotica]KAF7301036.1 Protein kinase [Mycena indigotica]
MSTSESPDLQFVIDAESPYNYEPNGFHPVHLGDSFADGRYQVVHKLGHGLSSTIWLVLDTQTSTYKSLKIIAAWKSVTELPVLQHLEANFSGQEEGSNHVGQMLDHFVHEGPNGRHQCIVGEVLGPTLASYIGCFWDNDCYPPDMVRRLFGQIALGVTYLHRRGVAHGDLHPANILLRLPMAWTSPAEVDMDIRKPEECAYGVINPSPHQPRYLVPGIQNNHALLKRCFENNPHIKICDFSESNMPSLTDPPRLASPLMLCPPDALLGFAKHPTIKTDIWALAVLCHMLFCGNCGLFFNEDNDRMLRDMVLNLGKLPEPLWSSWAGRDAFNDDGHPKNGAAPRFLKFRIAFIPDEGERTALEALLRSMVNYDEQARITAEQVVESEWVQRYCVPQMGPASTFVVEYC